MKADVKQKWLEALRSGDYQQGKNVLRSSFGPANTYCCLGVLCDILPQAEWKPYNGRWRIWHGFEIEESYVPQNLASELELTHPHQRILARMNDEGRSFEEIADYIEEYV